MAATRGKEERKYSLEVPLDASGIEEFKPERPVKVAVRDQKDHITSQTVELNAQGKGRATFTFSSAPGPLSIVVGPGDAEDSEIFGLQTLQANLAARRWVEPKVVLPAFRIPPYHWHWWLRWCRWFTVRGRVVCPDGRPVPGAKVCAFDVDVWWWWSSKQLVGCATTDATGAFEIKFRWCCGWWPWWWWRHRFWHLDPWLLEKIIPPLMREPRIPRIPLPDPPPDLRVFEELLGADEFAALNLRRLQTQARAPASALEKAAKAEAASPAASLAGGLASQAAINPDVIAELREPLLRVLPRLPELELLHIWPWWPWQPWWDCSPDIIFRVAQDCGGEQVIIDEGYGQTRWNIPTSIDVTLIANDKACCLIDDPGDPEGMCALITNVCDDGINDIGGNPPHAPVTVAPVGYLNPGLASVVGDRPYAERVLIQGQVGTEVDYYAFIYSSDNGLTWNDLPVSAIGDIPRRYWIPTTNTFQDVPFLGIVDGKLVFESRLHYEATHAPGDWGSVRFWMANNYFSLLNWFTTSPFLNGMYRLRIKGWKLVGGHLVDETVLPVCSIIQPAEVVLRIDNRLEGPGSGHPLADPNHPCGAGTVHTCTLEPDTDVLGVRIVRRNEFNIPTGEVVAVGPCGNVPIGPHDLLQVDFIAHDPEGHLARYTLQATYKENLARNLLTQPSASLTPYLGPAPVPAASQVGPTYTAALLTNPLPQATSPTWAGGAIRLEVLASEAFPETCCYQLELRAHKRTVVGCDHSIWGHINYSEFSFMVVVP
jgi:hypothetical protein